MLFLLLLMMVCSQRMERSWLASTYRACQCKCFAK